MEDRWVHDVHRLLPRGVAGVDRHLCRDRERKSGRALLLRSAQEAGDRGGWKDDNHLLDQNHDHDHHDLIIDDQTGADLQRKSLSSALERLRLQVSLRHSTKTPQINVINHQ